jgi:hypothetical protein
MAGKHRLRNRRVQRTTWHRAIEVVDARTLTTHFLTADALAAGWTRGVFTVHHPVTGDDHCPWCRRALPDEPSDHQVCPECYGIRVKTPGLVYGG